jgi:hypothetical protein
MWKRGGERERERGVDMLWNLIRLALTQFEYYMIKSNKLYILKF